jgi:thioredoxin-like negative regulator of GroEL
MRKMKKLLMILIPLEVILALVAFTPLFINSNNTAQTASQALVKTIDNSTPENEAAWLSAKAKCDRERWIMGIAAFGVVSLPGVIVAVIGIAVFRRKNMRPVSK